ncbi:glycoside hydrolase family 3 N-terminal domain-containing protein [Prevotella sp.]|uniref:glycoside hydrolase family 3 N-terminal domain-containing protein n=1 Tax=Prevotella sp. TaxID=59823 RepID=UPI002F93D056
MNKLTLLTAALCLVLSANAAKKKPLPYQDKRLSVEQRVSDLLSRMTLEEKVGQLRCTLAWNYYDLKGKSVVPGEQFKKDIKEGNIGMLWATYRADPWTRKSLDNGLTPEMAAKCGNALQKYVMENTRLGIPLFLAEEAPHGHMAIGTTVFPTGLGMAATWNPELIEQVGRIIAKEVRLQGGHISYGPVLDVSRDPRWSRVEESFGEDPTLTAYMGAAMVKGLGGGKLHNPFATLATLKHFIGYGTTEGGQNGNPTFLGMREIHESFLPPFKRAIDAGALSVMTSYNSLDGIPSTANSYFLTDVLQKGWNFRGFVVSDLYSIDGIWQTHHVAATRDEAGIMALNAGVDADLGALAYEHLADAVRKGQLSEDKINAACARILRMKFEMGLFDNPYVDPKAAREVRNADAIATAREAARQLVTLLKNKNNTLPLAKDMKVAVIGPNADNVYNLLGDYTAPQERSNVKTILDGVKTKLPAANIEYVKGCAVRDTNQADIAAAVAAAKRADAVIVAVGGSSARDFKTSYKETGAAVSDSKSLSDMDCGEGFDRATLTLLGRQQELLEALRQTGKPLIVVYIEGRPLEKTWADEHADALLTAYYPGQEGGQAIADVIFGDYNPAGRLPVSVARHIGQLPVYYNKKAPAAHDYVEMSARPLYSFGYGLSYTTFDYANLSVERKDRTTFNVSLDVTNTGTRDGEEVAQLYLHDELASTTQPLMQLKHFKRVMIKRGETQRISFTLTADDLSIVDQQLKRVVEPGDFTLMIGSASDNIKLKTTITVDR